MDKIHEFVKTMQFKNAVMGGFDKESVYATLKDLVALFEEELTQVDDEKKQLEETMQQMKNQSFKQTSDDDIQQIKKIIHAYHQLEKQLQDYQKENQEKDLLIEKIKGQSDLERINLQKQYQQLQEQYYQIKQQQKEPQSIEFIKQSYQKSIDILTKEFYQKNQSLILENQKLKEQLEQIKRQDQNDTFQSDMEDLMKSMNRLKEKYIKEVKDD